MLPSSVLIILRAPDCSQNTEEFSFSVYFSLKSDEIVQRSSKDLSLSLSIFDSLSLPIRCGQVKGLPAHPVLTVCGRISFLLQLVSGCFVFLFFTFTFLLHEQI